MEGGGSCNEDENGSGFISTSPRPEVGGTRSLFVAMTLLPCFSAWAGGLPKTRMPDILDSTFTLPKSVTINLSLTLYGPSTAPRLTYDAGHWAGTLVTLESPGGGGAGMGGAFENPHV